MIIIVKFLLSVFSVIILAEVSKRINPVIGGLLSGLPLGTGLSVYFITYNNGIDYITSGIPWGIAALSSSILFCLTYLIIGKLVRKKIPAIMISSTCGIFIFLLWGLVLSSLKLNIYISIALFLLFFIINIPVSAKYADESEFKKKKTGGAKELLTRGVIVGIIILVITTIGSAAGSRWAGILSSFPSTLFSLIIVLHYEDGNSLYPSILKGFSFGVSTLLVFYICCKVMFPIFGLNIGFIVAFAVCLIYLVTINQVKNRIAKVNTITNSSIND